MQLRPAIYSARDGRGVDPCAEIRYSLALEEIDGQRFRSPAAGIQAVELSGFGVPVENHQIAADAIHHRLHHADHGICGDRGIRRRPASLQNLCRGGGGQGLAGGYDPIPRYGHGTGLRPLELRVQLNHTGKGQAYRYRPKKFPHTYSCHRLMHPEPW